MRAGDVPAAATIPRTTPTRAVAFLAAADAGARERRIASAVLLISVVVFGAITPLAHVPLPPVVAFVTAYEAALVIVELITAALLLSQARQLGSRPVAILAAGYLFAACLIVPHLLTFPGIVSSEADEQTAAWLVVFWHGGFIVWVIAYAVSGTSGKPRQASVRAVAAIGVGAALGCIVLSVAGTELLPALLLDGAYTRFTRWRLGPALAGLCLIALAAIWHRSRFRSVLDLWLGVVMFLWLLDVGVAAIAGARRFDLGFYASRGYGLASASFVLVAFLLDADRLYGRLADALESAEARNLALEQSREQLARAQRLEAVGQLTGGIAHDFNNLLTVIIGNLELIQRHAGATERIGQLAATALGAAERGARLTHQLLTFARRQVSRPETVNLNRLVSDLEPLLRRAAGEAVAVTTSLSPVLDPTRVDPSQFEAAILNLIVNARDAIAGGGRIEIETRNAAVEPTGGEPPDAVAPGRYVLIMVRDSGAGMSQSVRARAFEPFFTTKAVGKGSGLGLSQVYGFARAAGGHVWIDSAPGAGATVSLYLPRSAERAATVARRVPASSTPTNGHEAILVVEDDPDVQTHAVQGLAELGYDVCAAADAREALDILRSGRPVDLLFSDIVMPGGMNGAELAAEAARLRPGLKVLLTSGYAAAALSSEHGIADHVDVLGKPYRRDELAMRLRRALGGAPNDR